MKKKTIIYVLGILLIVLVICLKFVSGVVAFGDVSDDNHIGASWNALSAGSFIFN